MTPTHLKANTIDVISCLELIPVSHKHYHAWCPLRATTCDSG